jgi:NADPH:quinone reductase-like Zn-dependent oxidoreductase
MRAIVNTVYGEPEVLELKDIAKPVHKKDEVLIKMVATTINRTDCGFRNPEYFIVRLVGGIFKPRKTILGNELAGVIEATGSEVKSFKIGDEVFGLSAYKFGTHAEYICKKETGSIAIKPINMDFEQAAAVCDGLMLGFNLIKNVNFNTKPKILINGATGSIGTACLQLAKHFGADVTAVCNTKSIELMKHLGASEVIDYSKVEFKCKKLLKPGGIYMSTELGAYWQNVFFALITPLLGGKKVLFPIPTDSQADIIKFKELIEKGNYKAIIDRKYPLEQMIEAVKYVETGEKIGNVVITF